MAYSAFISYSHSADDRFADALQRALHRFAKPWYRLRALRIFRDQTNLSANPALWPSIEQALQDSKFFLLLASPRAAASKWVRPEVEYWRAQRSSQTLLLVLTDGELCWDAERRDFDWDQTTAIPRALEGYFSDEPLWVDFRANKSEEQLSLRSASFRTRVANLAAPIHGKNKDELDGDDLREHRRTIRVASLAVAGLVILLCAAVVGAWIANEQRKLKDRQRQIAVSRLLAAESAATLAPDMESRERSAILALESLRRLERMSMRSLEADQALRSALAILGNRRFAFDVGSSVNDVAFGPDGETIVAASVYGGPKRWQLRTEQPIVTWQREQRVRQVVLSADGGYQASADFHPSGLEVWVEPVDAAASLAPRRYLGQPPIAVSASGRYLALGALDRRDVQLIDLALGETAERLPAADQVTFSRDGGYVAAATIGSTQVWRLQPGDANTLLHPVSLHRSPPGAIAFSADSRFLAIRDRDEDQVLVLNLNDGNEVARLTAMRDPGQSMALSADARYLAMARVNDVLVRDVATGAIVLLAYGREIRKLTFDPNTPLLAAAGVTNELIAWEIAGLSEKVAIKSAGAVEAMHIAEAPAVLTVLTRDTAATGTLVSRRYRLDDGSLPRGDRVHGPGRGVLSGNGKFVAAPESGRIKIWAMETGLEEAGRSDAVAVSVLAVSNDGRHAAVQDSKGVVRVLDRVSGEPAAELSTMARDVAVTLGPSGWYMIGTTTRKVGEGTRGSRAEATRQVWDLRQHREVPTLVFTDRILPVLFIDPTATFVAQDSPAVENLATGARESSAGLLRPIVQDSPDARFTYSGTFAAFSPNGEHFVTRSDVGGLNVWDRVSRREIARLPQRPAAGVAALSDSAKYLGVVQNGAIQVWPLAPSDLRRQGCQMITLRGLGPVMWPRFWDTDPYEDTCAS